MEGIVNTYTSQQFVQDPVDTCGTTTSLLDRRLPPTGAVMFFRSRIRQNLDLPSGFQSLTTTGDRSEDIME
jgi:hypothetical protein